MNLNTTLFIVSVSFVMWLIWLAWAAQRYEKRKRKRKNEDLMQEEKPKREILVVAPKETFEHTMIFHEVTRPTTLWGQSTEVLPFDDNEGDPENL